MDQINKIVANHNLKTSGEKLDTVYNSVVELQNEMRSHSYDFYYRLSLLSGGILSLSITYIGYLSSKQNNSINFTELLFFSWVCLLLTIICSFYRNHFNLNMGHYQTLESLNSARLQNYEASLVMMKNFPEQFVDLSKDRKNSQIEITESNMEKVRSAIKSNKAKEKINSMLWVLTEKVSHISFISGMIIITIFAALNLPIKLNYQLFDFLKSL